MAYITEHRDEVEVEYQLVLQQAKSVRAYWEERNRTRLEEIAKPPPKAGHEMLISKLHARKTDLGLS